MKIKSNFLKIFVSIFLGLSLLGAVAGVSSAATVKPVVLKPIAPIKAQTLGMAGFPNKGKNVQCTDAWPNAMWNKVPDDHYKLCAQPNTAGGLNLEGINYKLNFEHWSAGVIIVNVIDAKACRSKTWVSPVFLGYESNVLTMSTPFLGATTGTIITVTFHASPTSGDHVENSLSWRMHG